MKDDSSSCVNPDRDVRKSNLEPEKPESDVNASVSHTSPTATPVPTSKRKIGVSRRSSSPTRSWKRRRASRFSEMFKEDFLYFDDSSDEEDAGDLLPVNPSPSSKTKATATKAAITRDSEVADEKVSAPEQTMPEVQPQTRTNARTKANIVARLKWKTANKNCSASSPSQSRAETKKEVRSSHDVPANDGPSQDSKPKGSRRELKTLDDTVSDTEVPRTPILRTYSRAQNRAIADEGSSSTASPRTPILSALQASIVPLTRCNGGQSEERKASGSPQVVSSMDDIIVSYEDVESAHKPRPISRKKVGISIFIISS